MTIWMKQSTAASVVAGPFVDGTDGITSLSTLTSETLTLFKNGASSASASYTVTYKSLGYYGVDLTTSHTDTVGHLRVAFGASSYVPVWEDYLIVPANVYDSFVGGTDTIDATLAASGLPDTAIATAAGNLIADHVLRREWGNAASSTDGDAKTFRSVLGATAKLVNKISASGTQFTVYEADDTTALATQTTTSSSTANAITGLDTD